MIARYTTLAALLIATVMALLLTATPVDAFSGFKGRYVAASNACVYTDAAGVERTVAHNDIISARRDVPELDLRNASCSSCPDDTHKLQITRPAKLVCVQSHLVVLEPAICKCTPKSGQGIERCRICVHDRMGGKGCSGWTPKDGGQSSWSRWIYHEGGVASTQRKRFMMECR